MTWFFALKKLWPQRFWFVGMHGTTMDKATMIAQEGFKPTDYPGKPSWCGVYLSTDPDVPTGYGDTTLYVYVPKDKFDKSKPAHFYRDYACTDDTLAPCDRGIQERLWVADPKLLRISARPPPKDVDTRLAWGDMFEDGSWGESQLAGWGCRFQLTLFLHRLPSFKNNCLGTSLALRSGGLDS